MEVQAGKKPWWKRWWGITVLVIIGMSILRAIAGPQTEDPNSIESATGPTSVVAQSEQSTDAEESNAEIGLLPAVDSFLKQHKEFGEPVKAQPVPDWAKGKRQRVEFASGRSLLFYTVGTAVTTVWEEKPGGGREVVWGETATDKAPEPVKRAAESDLPAYTVLFEVDKASGDGRFGEVLVPTLSRKVAAKKRESVARAIAAKEGLDDLVVYSTKDAYEANNSASFLKSHPDALRTGLLGSLADDVFTPGEALFP